MLALLGASLALGVVAPAQAAAPAACVGSLYATDTGSSGDIYPVSLSGVVGAKAYETSAQPETPQTVASNPNQLGIGAGGSYAINTSAINGVSTIVNHDFATGTNRYLTKQLGANVSGIAGAINPENGFYYYGGTTSSASPYVLWAYNPVTNTSTGPVASIDIPGAPGGNGDIAFGSDGTLYLVASSTNTTNLYRASAALPTGGAQQSYTAELLTSTTGLSAATNGVAFASDGYLYLGTNTTLQKVNPINGARVGASIAFSGTTINSVDLGTCAGPNTVEAGVTLPDNRLTPGDQFTTTVTGGSYTNPPVFPSGTTQGTDAGPQTLPAETAGPGIVLPAETYTVSVTGAPGTNIDDYATNYRCTNESGATTRTGQGTSFEISPEEGVGIAENCSFSVQNPMDLTKSVSPTSFDSIGDELTYTFVASNADSAAATNFRISDPMPGLGEITCAPYAQGDLIPAGMSTECTATYTATGDDVRSRNAKNNTATVTTDPRPGATRTSSATSSVSAANTATPVVATDDTAQTPSATSVTLPASTNDTAGSSPVVVGSTVFTSPAATNSGRELTTPSGTWTVQVSGEVRFAPAAGFAGSTSVDYEVSDANGFTDTATLTVTVRPGPDAENDTATTPQNVTVTTPVLDNDTPGTRADGTDGAFDTATMVFPPVPLQPGTISNEGRTLTVTGEGVHTINPDTGVITFDPDPDFEGPTAIPVTYRVTDQATNTVTAMLTITIRPIAPTATDDHANTPYATPVTLPGATNDTPGTDNNNTPLDTTDDTTPAIVATATVFPAAGQPTGSTITDEGKRLHNTDGTWVIQPNGSVHFTPAPGFNATTDPVTYRIEDTNTTTDTATLTVTVRPGPDAENDTATTPQNVTVTTPVLDNDTPGTRADGTDGAFNTATMVFPPVPLQPGTISNEGRTLTVTGEGVHTINPDTGVITFDPDPDFEGPTAIPVTYRVTDQATNTVTAMLTITIRPIAPTATDDHANTPYATPVTLPGATNDTPGTDNNNTPLDTTDDTTPAIVATATVFPAAGQPTGSTITDEGKRLHNTDGTWVIQPNGSVHFTPAPGFNATTDPVTYRIEDTNTTTDTATLTVTVRPGPDAENDTATTPQNVTVTTPVLDNDTPGKQADGTDGTWVVSSVRLLETPALPSGSEVSGAGKTLTVIGEGTWTVEDDGAVTFDPLPPFTGAASPVTYAVTDSLENPDTASIAIVVTGIDPVANDDSAVTRFGDSVVLPGATDDTAGADSAPIVGSRTVFPAAGQPADATVSDGGSTLRVPREGVWTVLNDGSVRFAPADGFSGVASPVTYRIEDANGTTDSAVLSVTVRPGPVPAADSAATPQNVTVTIDVIANDTPAIDVDGSTRATYDRSTVVLVATPGLPSGSAVSGDGTILTVPGQGTWTVTPTGSVSFDPLPAFTGVTAPVTYEVTDSFGNVSGSTITVSVDARIPAAIDDSASTTYGTPVLLDVLSNDLAATGAPLDPGSLRLLDPVTGVPVTELVVAGEGTWTVVDGAVRFTPADGFTGSATPVGYVVADSNGTPARATITVVVGAPGAAVPVKATTSQGEPVVLDILDGVTPAVGETLEPQTVCLLAGTVIVDGDPARGTGAGCLQVVVVDGVGTFEVNPDGTVTFTPTDGFTGTVGIDFQVQDTGGNVYEDAITVLVEGESVTSDAPTVREKDDVLPDTGGVPFALLLASAISLLLGSAMMWRGRRRA